MAMTRSPNYPAVSLPDAVELVERLYQREKRSPADPERVALAFGYTSLSGPARTKLSALRKYELVDETANGVRVSELAMKILFPRSPEEKTAALREAATQPALFRELASLPGASDENLVSRLVHQGFTEQGAKLAVASFRKTMSLAPDEASSYDESHEETYSMLTAPAETTSMRPSGADLSTQAISIALPGGGRADLRLSGTVTSAGLKLVEDYLDLVKKSVSAQEAAAAADASRSSLAGSTELALPAEQSHADAQE
jgi:hypothetical protein